jgi:hypothetical protein
MKTISVLVCATLVVLLCVQSVSIDAIRTASQTSHTRRRRRVHSLSHLRVSLKTAHSCDAMEFVNDKKYGAAITGTTSDSSFCAKEGNESPIQVHGGTRSTDSDSYPAVFLVDTKNTHNGVFYCPEHIPMMICMDFTPGSLGVERKTAKISKKKKSSTTPVPDKEFSKAYMMFKAKHSTDFHHFFVMDGENLKSQTSTSTVTVAPWRKIDTTGVSNNIAVTGTLHGCCFFVKKEGRDLFFLHDWNCQYLGAGLLKKDHEAGKIVFGANTRKFQDAYMAISVVNEPSEFHVVAAIAKEHLQMGASTIFISPDKYTPESATQLAGKFGEGTFDGKPFIKLVYKFTK